MPDEDVLKEVGGLVASARAGRNLSPTALAAKAGVDVKTVRSLESGLRWPQDVTRAKIERALGLEVGLIASLMESADLRAKFKAAIASPEWRGPSSEDVDEAERKAADAELAQLDEFEFLDKFLAQTWDEAHDLVGALRRLDSPPEDLREVTRRIIFTLSGFLIMRILSSSNAARMEHWLQRIYTEREQLFREVTIGEPQFPWVRSQFEDHAAAAASAVQTWSVVRDEVGRQRSTSADTDAEPPTYPQAARTAPHGYKLGQSEHGAAGGEESQDLGDDE